MSEAIHEEVRERYREPENHRVMQAAALTSERCANLTRVEETMEFARAHGRAEARHRRRAPMPAGGGAHARASMLRTPAGFEVFGVACKVEGDSRAPSSACRPTADGGEGAVLVRPACMQARLLEEAGTDLNIVMGLCVGHDIAVLPQRSARPLRPRS